MLICKDHEKRRNELRVLANVHEISTEGTCSANRSTRKRRKGSRGKKSRMIRKMKESKKEGKETSKSQGMREYVR